MSIKFLIPFLLISKIFLDTTVPVIKLPQYGELRLYEKNWLYLSLDGYKEGDEIYLILRIEDGFNINLNNLVLNVCETDDYLNFNIETLQFITDYKYMEERPHIMNYYIYYTIKLQANYKYLIIITPYKPDQDQDIHEPEIPED